MPKDKTLKDRTLGRTVTSTCIQWDSRIEFCLTTDVGRLVSWIGEVNFDVMFELGNTEEVSQPFPN